MPVCLSGSCVACSPGSTTCAGNGLQTCDASGAWTTSACPYVCSNGACSGGCVPSTTQCSGSDLQTCSALRAFVGDDADVPLALRPRSGASSRCARERRLVLGESAPPGRQHRADVGQRRESHLGRGGRRRLGEPDGVRRLEARSSSRDGTQWLAQDGGTAASELDGVSGSDATHVVGGQGDRSAAAAAATRAITPPSTERAGDRRVRRRRGCGTPTLRTPATCGPRATPGSSRCGTARPGHRRSPSTAMPRRGRMRRSPVSLGKGREPRLGERGQLRRAVGRTGMERLQHRHRLRVLRRISGHLGGECQRRVGRRRHGGPLEWGPVDAAAGPVQLHDDVGQRREQHFRGRISQGCDPGCSTGGLA